MKKYSGFTLIELMITLILLGVLMAIGVPSLKSFLQRNQLIASTNELLSAFHIARSEAIKLNSRVSICASTDGTKCSGSNNWKTGWIVFVDENGDFNNTGSACSATGADCLLRIHEAVTDNALSITGPSGNYTFTSRGLPKDMTGIAQPGTFSLCSKDSTGAVIASRAVVLSLSGRVRVSDNAAVITCP